MKVTLPYFISKFLSFTSRVFSYIKKSHCGVVICCHAFVKRLAKGLPWNIRFISLLLCCLGGAPAGARASVDWLPWMGRVRKELKNDWQYKEPNSMLGVQAPPTLLLTPGLRSIDVDHRGGIIYLTKSIKYPFIKINVRHMFLSA